MIIFPEVKIKAITNPMIGKEYLKDNGKENLRILVVEDTLINQRVARLFLEGFGYSVDIAANGKEALNKVGQGYVLILMDIGLPDIDGLEVTRIIREQNKQIPIIACTASGESYHSKCIDAGMTDFILKPVLADVLCKIINKYLKN